MGQVDFENRQHPRRRRDLRGDPFVGPAQAAGRPMMESDPPPPPGYNPEERSFFDRIGDEVRSWFGDHDAERRREYDELMHHSYAESHRIGFAPPGGAAGVKGYTSMTYPQSGFASSRLPASPAAHDRLYDLEYQAWRERQMSALDKEYQQYCEERQQRFNEGFDGWRARRKAQRASLENVKEHMEVVGSDGAHIGTVDCVKDDRVVLTRSDATAGGVHHSIPCRWIERVEDLVVLEISAAEAQARWSTERS